MGFVVGRLINCFSLEWYKLLLYCILSVCLFLYHIILPRHLCWHMKLRVRTYMTFQVCWCMILYVIVTGVGTWDLLYISAFVNAYIYIYTVYARIQKHFCRCIIYVYSCTPVQAGTRPKLVNMPRPFPEWQVCIPVCTMCVLYIYNVRVYEAVRVLATIVR